MMEFGLTLPMRKCVEICGELMIHHLVTYKSGSYSVARWDFGAEGRGDRQLYEAMLSDDIREAAAGAAAT